MKQLLPARLRVGLLRARQVACDVAVAVTTPKQPLSRTSSRPSATETDPSAEDAVTPTATSAHSPPTDSDVTGSTTRVIFEHLDEQIEVSDEQTILEAGLEADLDLAFSCTMGGCAACALQIVEGEVAYDGPNCLTEDEKKAGMCLACVGRPDGPVVLTSRY